MEQFTLEEARRWLGHTVIAKAAFHVDQTAIAAEQQGTVVGIHGEPDLCLVVQFWPAQQDAAPRVVFVPKRTFNTYLCLSHTVELPAP